MFLTDHIGKSSTTLYLRILTITKYQNKSNKTNNKKENNELTNKSSSICHFDLHTFVQPAGQFLLPFTCIFISVFLFLVKVFQNFRNILHKKYNFFNTDIFFTFKVPHYIQTYTF